jgi:hypothetical protein
LPIQEADEGTCAAALLRLTLPARRETVYWTTGHGEYALDAYDSLSGMSDFARDLRRDGYALKALDITAAPSLPGDCALLVVAGARTAFSREELQRVEGYLRSGGRLLALVTRDAAAGVGGLLARWGVRAQPFTVVSPRTLNGADLPVTDFADHVITRPLKGVTLLFGETAPIFSVAGARASDHMTFTPLVQTDAQAWGESDTSVRPWTYDAAHEPSGPLVLAAALERGAQAGAHVAFRPMRAVLIGDAAFALNAALASRAHAHRDFLLNAVLPEPQRSGKHQQQHMEAAEPGNMVFPRLKIPQGSALIQDRVVQVNSEHCHHRLHCTPDCVILSRNSVENAMLFRKIQ